jgi:transposase InsO family protein
VIDLFSRRVIGWSVANHTRTDIVADALTMAVATRGVVSTESYSVATEDRKADSMGRRNTLILEVVMGRPAG